MASFSDMTSWQNWSPTLARMYLDVSRSRPSCTAGAGSHRPMAMESLCWGLRKPSTRRMPFLVNASLDEVCGEGVVGRGGTEGLEISFRRDKRTTRRVGDRK